MASSYINLSSNQPKYCSGRIDWQSTAYPSGCYSLLNAQVYVILNGWGIQGTGSGSWQENGTTVETFSPKVNVAYGGTGTTHVYTKNGTRVNHNTSSGNGSISLGCSMAFSFAGINYVSGSGTANMDWIPRYATSNQSLSSKTLNTITMNWSSDNTCDYIWYSKDNGSTWTGIDISDGKSGSYTITGLEPATTYNIKTRVRRKDSQLTTDSSALSVTTYDIAKITEAPATVVIGNDATIKFTNPSGADMQLAVYYGEDTVIREYRTPKASPYTFTFTQTQIDSIYSLIPNDTKITLRFYVSTTQNNVTYYHYLESQFTIDETINKPVFDSTLTCEDTNNMSLALTGNKNKFLLGYSKALVTISTAAQAKNKATISKYNITDGITLVSPTQTSAPFTGTIDPINGTVVEAQVIDSRGLTNSITKELDIIQYKTPLINATTNLKRVGGVGTSVTFNFSGYIWNETFGSVHNSIKSFKYKMLPETKTNWDSVEWINIDSSKYTLAADGTITNTKDAILPNFTVGTEYLVRIYIEDELNSISLETSVGSGSPITAYNKTKKLMGVGKIPERTLPEGSIDAKGQVWQEGVQVMNQSTVYSGNVDDISKTSYYYCNNCTNLPVDYNGYLFTQIYNSNYAYQQYITYNRDAKFERHKAKGIWSDWEEFNTGNSEVEADGVNGALCRVGLTTNQYVNKAAGTAVNFDLVMENDPTVFSVQNGAVTILDDRIKSITVNSLLRAYDSTGWYIYIWKNGTNEFARSIANQSSQVANCTFDVKKGDVIQTGIYFADAAHYVNGSSDGVWCQMSIVANDTALAATKETPVELAEELIFDGKLYPQQSLTYDFSKYKRLIISYAMYDAGVYNNTGGSSNIAMIELSDSPSMGWHRSHVLLPYIVNGSVQSVATDAMIAEFSVIPEKTRFDFYAWYKGMLATSATQYYVRKIIGVRKDAVIAGAEGGELNLVNEYSTNELKAYNCTYINDLNKEIDLTSQMHFVNCTLKHGGVYKIGRVVYINMIVTSTITSGWGTIIQNLPAAMDVAHPTTDGGIPIGSSPCWLYGSSGNPAMCIRGGVTANGDVNLFWNYIAKT